MFFIPLPFIVALVLVFLLAQMRWRQGAVVMATPQFLLLLGGYALLSVLVGLRWGYGIKLLLPLQATLAVSLAPWALRCYQTLAVDASVVPWQRLHALPTLGVMVLIVWWPQAVDVAVVLVYLGYGLALLRLARRGPDALGLARLEQVPLVHRMLQATAVSLLLSAAVDACIAWDIVHSGGRHSAVLLGGFQLLLLLFWGYAASVAQGSLPERPTPLAEPARLAESAVDTSAPAASLADDQRTVAAVRQLLQAQRMYLEPDLNLIRLARKSGIPARQISAAINRLGGKNVSQYVNDFRIQHACELLRSTPQTVAEAMLASGFQTKSNFQREFRRVTGTTPLLWRQQAEHR